MVLSTSVEVHLKLELPVAVVNMAGNGKEGEKIITLGQQTRSHHGCRSKIDIADTKYDNNDPKTDLFCSLPEGQFLTLRPSFFFC
jgi:hypothetical protein